MARSKSKEPLPAITTSPRRRADTQTGTFVTSTPAPERRRASSWPLERSLPGTRSEEHTSELQSQSNLVFRLLLEKKKKIYKKLIHFHNYSLLIIFKYHYNHNTSLRAVPTIYYVSAYILNIILYAYHG